MLARHPWTARQGFTMVEMMISSTVLVALISVTFSLLRTSTDEFQTETTVTTLEGNALRALEVLTEEIRTASLVQVTPQVPTAPGSTNTLVFQEVIGFDGMAPVLGPAITYAYQWNATLNCGEVVRTENASSHVLVSRLQANGFRLERDPLLTNKVTIRLTLEMPGPYGNTIVRTVNTSVYPRN